MRLIRNQDPRDYKRNSEEVRDDIVEVFLL